MRKLYIFGLIALACIFLSQAFAEEFTMSTYYPAPYGVYNNMRVMNSLGVGTTNPTELLEVVGGTAASGSGRGITLQAESGEEFGSTDGGNIILMPGSGYAGGANGKVGIGTANPEATLQVDGTMKVFGAWETEINNTVYQASTDGFVSAFAYGWSNEVLGYTDSSNPPTTVRVADGYYSKITTRYVGITMPVRKGDYWKVIGADTVYWMPLGI